MTKAEKITGIILAILLSLTIINSTVYFLGIAKVDIIQWIVFNACAPSSIAYIAGFIIFMINGNKMWLSVAIVPLLFFGTMGMFVFPWDSYNFMAQLSHIIMTLNILWSLYAILKDRDFVSLGKGLLISVIMFIPFIAFTQSYCRVHAEDVMKILGI